MKRKKLIMKKRALSWIDMYPESWTHIYMN